jgi:hypothetical protein
MLFSASSLHFHTNIIHPSLSIAASSFFALPCVSLSSLPPCFFSHPIPTHSPPQSFRSANPTHPSLTLSTLTLGFFARVANPLIPAHGPCYNIPRSLCSALHFYARLIQPTFYLNTLSVRSHSYIRVYASTWRTIHLLAHSNI